jgi:archaellum component FlaG (FlaF/FlaG flagellin family)
MVVLVLAIFFIQQIFSLGTSAIDAVDAEIQSQIQELFAEEGRKVAVYPTSREITLKKGDTPKGFAFSVKNIGDVGISADAEFIYDVEALDVSLCGFSEGTANGFLLGGSGSFDLSPGNSLDFPVLIRFVIPETAPPCSMTYVLVITKDGRAYSTVDVLVTIK